MLPQEPCPSAISSRCCGFRNRNNTYPLPPLNRCFACYAVLRCVCCRGCKSHTHSQLLNTLFIPVPVCSGVCRKRAFASLPSLSAVVVFSLSCYYLFQFPVSPLPPPRTTTTHSGELGYCHLESCARKLTNEIFAQLSLYLSLD